MKKINTNLAMLFGGQFVSEIGDKFYNIAITFWVFKMTNSPAIMGTVLFAQVMSAVVTGLFAGSIVDSVNRKYVLVIADTVRGIVIALFTILFYCHIFNLTLIIIVAILLGVNTAFFNSAVPAVLPQMVRQDELLQASSKSQAISGMTNIIGPMLAGIAIAIFGYGIAFVVNAASYFISAYFESLMKLLWKAEKQTYSRESIKNKLIAGYKYIFNSRQIILLLVVVTIVHLFFGSILVVLPIMAKELSPINTAQLFGYFQSALGIGTIIVALLLSSTKIVKNESKLMFLGFTGIGAMFCAIATMSFMHGPFVIILLLLIVLSGFITTTWIGFRVILQKSVDNSMSGRVFGVVETICSSSIPVAMLVCGFFLEYFKYYSVLIVSGALLLVASFILSRFYFYAVHDFTNC